MTHRPNNASIRGAIHRGASKSCLLLAAMAASGLVGCGGGSGSHALPSSIAQNASIAGNDGSTHTQTLALSLRSGITEYPIPTANAGPSGIAAGPHGDIWFTEDFGNKIGKVTGDGKITEYPVPVSQYGHLSGITEGPDGNLWFTISRASHGTIISAQVGKITPDGRVTEYAVPTASMGADDITEGPDGNLWFTEVQRGQSRHGHRGFGSGQIGKITTSGAISEYPIPLGDSGGSTCPNSIVAGRDGNLWFTEGCGNRIEKITTSGKVTVYPLPTAGAYPEGIDAGRDGNLWFTEYSGNKIGKITTGGAITEYPIPTGNPEGIAADRDGNLWFTEWSGNKIGKITTGGKISEYPIPTANALPDRIALGPNGNLWFTEFIGNKIGKINPANL
jgi:streptogramin lyase